ncbi:MAG: peptidoglycan DD-metalloendopeptidase family protein [Oscillibacter sp.]|jgi:murein DD-endopeptidase MepM/ murein hydrolase activator NlpD|nr:peptidoglycan DD-metalloendopeptidase family protein [Oscillibacter sp.]MCI9001979.1 peptidoglycan DD-metalloendopeptidase family protein [Oscillibacter sp.]
MSKHEKKTAASSPPPKEEARKQNREQRSPKPETATLVQDDFPDGWSPWRDWEQTLPPTVRDWTPEDRENQAAPRRRRTASKGSPSRNRQDPARKPRSAEGQTGSLRQTIAQKKLHFRRRWRRIVRENKAHRFPESERLPVQMMLFFWGMLPMWGNLFQERVLQKNSASRQKSAQSAQRKRRWRIHPVAFLAGGCVLAAVLLFFSTYTMGTTVTYDGKVLAALSDKTEAEEAREELERVTARTLGRSFTIDDSLIQYSSGLLRRQDLVDKETYEEALSEEVGMVTSAYCLYVDGERIGATPYKGALEQLLEQIQLSATNEGTISVSFAENVEVKEEFVATDSLMNLGFLAETLYSTKTAEVTYTVAKGDTWSEIAEDHDLTSKELLALNPGYDIDKLQIGEILTMSASVPYLTMTVVQQERYVDNVAFDVEYTDSADIYVGDYRVTSAGQYGAADTVANVTYINGQETERTVLSSVTLREPVTEHRLQGTKPKPITAASGTFRWPTTGRISSRFGGRSSPGGIGSTNHKGIDIAVPYRTPIYAADGGTVTYAGWMGGYGYLVQIDHGNGYVTRYGHNSSLTVSVGQKVYKGQQIARAGSTGNSTGNHCHFEVRYNGVAKNPLNYL